MRRQHNLVHDLAFLTVPMRLAKTLLFYARADPKTSMLTLPSYLNQTELAYLVGSTRESVNQCLKLFVRQGLIRVEARSIRITDKDGLERVFE